METGNVEVVRRIYAAWDRGEFPGPPALLDPDIEYVDPPDDAAAGLPGGRPR